MVVDSPWAVGPRKRAYQCKPARADGFRARHREGFGHDDGGVPAGMHVRRAYAPAQRKEAIVIGFIIALLLAGLIAGAIARLLVPGRDPMSIPATILLGIIGSFVGGFLADVLFRPDSEDRGLEPAGIIGSVIGAVIALLIYRWWQRRRGPRETVFRGRDAEVNRQFWQK
jgi:uncharacterized membrane protein YeaQ/YmgE (transglycosylase-associated protein family)